MSSGYIVTDRQGAIIYGVGDTADAAWSDMEREFSDAGIDLIEDDVDSGTLLGAWSRASNYIVLPATAALLADVRDRGGDIEWYRTRDGVACVESECEQ